MLKNIDITLEKISEYPIDTQASIAHYICLLKSGRKIDFKFKITKKHKYINVYEYDKKRWKYILIDSLEI